MNNRTLAIIIPAYKAEHLDSALKSISQQSIKEFKVYIGDDNSPEDLYSIVNRYQDILSLVYHKFDENLGGHNLVRQWERCINLSRQEEWIWLFSDDDVMESSCVEFFFKSLIATEEKFDLYRFNTTRINKFNSVIKRNAAFPDLLSVDQYATYVLKGADTFVVEYIFRRRCLLEIGGFVPFDLAWGSDTATWLAIANRNGIYTIQGPRVRWRYGGANISSLRGNPSITSRKIAADLAFFKWLDEFQSTNNFQLKVSAKVYWIARQLSEKKHLKWTSFKQYVHAFFEIGEIADRYLTLVLLLSAKFKTRAFLVQLLRQMKIIN